jgi:hypothetical protein
MFEDAPRLTIELVPKPLWKGSLAETLPRSQWNRLRAPCVEAAGRRCEICGGVGTKGRVEVHEVWRYDDEAHVQTLVRLICLCPACHAVKHLGRTTNVGYRDEAVATLKRVNRWSDAQVRQHEASARREWVERSRHEWTQDLSAVLP